MKKITFFATIILFFSPFQAQAYNIGPADVHLDASVGEGYDSNVTYLKDNPISDFHTDFGLGLTAELEGKKRDLKLGVRYLREQYFNRNNLSGNTYNFDLDFLQEITRFSRINIKERYLNSEDPDSFADQFGGMQNMRSKYQKNDFDIAYTKDFGPHFSMTANYFNQLYLPSRSDQESSDLNLVGIEGDIYVSPKTMLLGLVQYAQRDFEHGDTIRTNRFAAGFKQYLYYQMYLDCRFGMDFTGISHGDDSNGQFISASLVNDIDERTKFLLTYLDEDSSTYYRQSIFESQRVSLELRHQIFRRLDGTLALFYGKGKYVSTGVDEKFQGASINLTYGVSTNTSLDLMYSFSDSNSSDDSDSYLKNSCSIGLRYHY